jgi:uncharacterized protein
MTDTSPLLEIYHRLRARQFPLGPQEYETAQRALLRGFGLGSRQQLLFLCQTLWAKSRSEQEQVREVFDLVLPPEFSERELDEYLTHCEQTEMPEPERPPARQAPQPTAPQTPSGPPTSTASGGGALPEVQHTLNLTQQPAALEINLPEPRVQDWPVNPNWDFISELPLTSRQLKGAWRYLRRMRRIGQRVELDIEGTLEQTYRQGVMLEPVLRPRRTNQARLLLLVDEGGSMTPFRYLTQALIESAQQSGLAEVTVRYFHDVPLRYLFSDPRMNRQHAEKVEAVIEGFAGSSVLILSDGGAARGSYDENRVRQTVGFLSKLRGQRCYVAWLNPTPGGRWIGASVEKVGSASQIKLQSYDRLGLDKVVSALRGK